MDLLGLHTDYDVNHTKFVHSITPKQLIRKYSDTQVSKFYELVKQLLIFCFNSLTDSFMLTFTIVFMSPDVIKFKLRRCGIARFGYKLMDESISTIR